MKVTRDVIVDLWSVYESGAASADTRAVVDEFLRSDPEFARLIRAERSREMMEAVTLSPDVEKAGLVRAEKLLRYRTYCLLLACFFAIASAMLRVYRPFNLIAGGAALLAWLGLWIWERQRRAT